MIGKPYVVVLALGLMSSCGSTPTAPLAPDVASFAGTWTGSLADDRGAVGTARFVLTQNGPGVSGTFAMTSASATIAASGTASGTVTGSSLTLFMTRSTPIACTPMLSLSSISATLMLNSNTLTGRYQSLNCTGVDAGSYVLSK